MAVRPVCGLAALALVLIPAGCGQREPRDSAATQREQLIRTALAALRQYDPATVGPGTYSGQTAAGRSVRLRVSGRRTVSFSIWLGCSGHRLRAFPDRPPALGPDGRFTYRERGRGYRLKVAGRVRPQAARGQVSLATRAPSGCRIRTSWRAASAAGAWR